MIVSIKFIKGLGNDFNSFGFDAIGRASVFEYTYNIAISKPMSLLGLYPAILVEEDLGGDVVL